VDTMINAQKNPYRQLI